MTTTVLDILASCRFTFINERELQDGIAQVLLAHGIVFEREFVASSTDRFDFLLPGGVVIETKIKGSWADCLRQIGRYMERDDVTGVYVVGTPHWLSRMPGQLLDKPVFTLRLLGSLI